MINSAENILQLRDINLARAEEEACRDVVKRIPQSEQLITEMAAHAREHEIRVEVRRQMLQSYVRKTSVQAPQSYPVVLDR